MNDNTALLRLHGFCVEIGAPKAVVGRTERNRIFEKMGMGPPNLSRPSFSKRFRFADNTFESIGQVNIPLRTPFAIAPINVQLDVVQTDIPALLGMDILDRELLIADTVANRLTKRVRVEHKDVTMSYVDEWSGPLYSAHGNHVFARMNFPSKVNFSTAKLLKLHKTFFHPSGQKLFNLLRHA